MSPTQMLGGLDFGSHLELRKIISTIFRLVVFNIDILQIRDVPGMSFNSIMPFRNLDFLKESRSLRTVI